MTWCARELLGGPRCYIRVAREKTLWETLSWALNDQEEPTMWGSGAERLPSAGIALRWSKCVRFKEEGVTRAWWQESRGRWILGGQQRPDHVDVLPKIITLDFVLMQTFEQRVTWSDFKILKALFDFYVKNKLYSPREEAEDQMEAIGYCRISLRVNTTWTGL